MLQKAQHMVKESRPDFERLVSTFRSPSVKAIVLMGSFARGDETAFSDVDLVRFRDGGNVLKEPETHLIDGTYVVVSDVGREQVEEWFTNPEAASTNLAGVRLARPLWDPDEDFERIQKRARTFVWDELMQAKADIWASSQMVGWIEEVQKGLAGLRVGDEGRMLNARFGLSWGMTKVLRVQRGILISGDNGSYPEVVQDVGPDSKWAILSRRAFGLEAGDSLREQVRSGLRLYAHTVELLTDVLRSEDRWLIDEVAGRIKTVLAEAG